MNMIDATGHHVSGADAQSLTHYDRAANELLSMVDDPVASVNAALVASPQMTMAHVLDAWLNLLGIEPAGRAGAHASCDAAEALDADTRERAHIAAARALANGRWCEAGLRLEDLSAEHPRDTLALQVGHQIDFFVSVWPPHLDVAATGRMAASDAATVHRSGGWDASGCAPARRAGGPTDPHR